MRLAILADIHGNIRALKAVIAHMQPFKPTHVVNLGDCFSGPLSAAATADMLMAMKWITVRGNHDRQLVETPSEEMGRSDQQAFQQLSQEALEWLRELPPQVRIGDDVLLCHGTPTSDSTYLMDRIAGESIRAARPDEILDHLAGSHAALVLCGHSHIQRLVKTGDRTFLNPGSVGLPAYTDDNPYHAVESGSPHARYATAVHQNGKWQITLHQVVYDWNAAAKDAELAGRPDWAYALRTGCALAAK